MSDLPTSPTAAYDALDVDAQRFVDRVMDGQSLTDAYAAEHPDANRDSARKLGSRWWTRVDIQAALRERKAQLAARVAVTPQRIVEEYAAVAFARMSTFVTWGPGGMLVMGDETLSPADLAAVAEVSEQEAKFPGQPSRMRIKLHPKVPALDKLCELFDVTPEVIKRLYPQVDLASPEAIEGVIDILKKARAKSEGKRAGGDS